MLREVFEALVITDYLGCRKISNGFVISKGKNTFFAVGVVKAAMLGPDGPTGQFFSDDNVLETGISPW
jgi:hypothetical protein